jgi:hypothetical protein
MPSSVINTIVHSVLTKSRKKLVMAAMMSNALMAWAMNTRRVEFEDGGKDITNPITLGRNPNVTSTEYYNQLPVAQTDEFNTLRYGWSRVVGSVIISDQEEDENKGEALIFKLVKAKMEVLEESIKEKFSEYLYGAGAGLDPNGLELLIPDDPTVGLIGGLDRAAEPQIRTSTYDFAGTLDSTNIEEAIDDVLLDLTMNSDKPDIIIAGRNWIRTYRAAVRDKLVINLNELKQGKGMVDLGFGGVAHDGIPMVYDEVCPVNKAYFINSKFLRMHILRGVNMKVKDLVAPWTMDASGQRVQWQGQWCQWRMFRTHAVVLM